jgi:cyclopropane fatty-acyl-phospholipid synthase-like methyltransferase
MGKLPHGQRVAGNRYEYDAELEAKAYDIAFYESARKEFAPAMPVIRDWFQRCLPDTKSVIDLGCGSGEMISCVKDLYDTWGVDFSEGAKVLGPQFLGDQFVLGDLTQPLHEQDSRLKRRFDVVFSVETYEHIHSEFEQAYLDNIKRFKPKHLVISCALSAYRNETRQKGRHHYNCMPFDEFMKKVQTAMPEMEGNFIASMAFQRLPRLRFFYRYNTIVFSRKQV